MAPTDAHLQALEKLLTGCGVQVKDLISEKRYIPLNAEETLAKFMVNNWPDEKLFNETVSALISECSNQGRKIRAFGEMVALLWAQGHSGATVHLEHLWNKFIEKESFCLFCAYPKSGFTDDITHSMQHICGTHSKMISGSLHQMTDIRFRGTQAV
jgi:hypothetical protein